MKLRSEETELVGRWVVEGAKSRADDVCRRIEHLTANVLQELAVSREHGAWETLFRDPADGRFWERTYPQGELHGGGPPALHCISEEEARKRYDF
jgi:hypothetical protein